MSEDMWEDMWDVGVEGLGNEAPRSQRVSSDFSCMKIGNWENLVMFIENKGFLRNLSILFHEF